MEKTSEIWAQGEDSVQEREGMDNRVIEEQEGMKRVGSERRMDGPTSEIRCE